MFSAVGREFAIGFGEGKEAIRRCFVWRCRVTDGCTGVEVEGWCKKNMLNLKVLIVRSRGSMFFNTRKLQKNDIIRE